jgi:TrmH family RNA methyltransferase
MCTATLPAPSLKALTVADDALVVVVDQVEKPGNIGAIIRTLEAAGGSALLVAGGSPAAIYSPQVIRNSRGLVFTLPCISASPQALASWLEQERFVKVAATPEATQAHWSTPLTGRTALLLGTEHDGLSAFWRDACDVSVSIPQPGRADSLNVATAAALLIYESLRQRSQQP